MNELEATKLVIGKLLKNHIRIFMVDQMNEELRPPRISFQGDFGLCKDIQQLSRVPAETLMGRTSPRSSSPAVDFEQYGDANIISRFHSKTLF